MFLHGTGTLFYRYDPALLTLEALLSMASMNKMNCFKTDFFTCPLTSKGWHQHWKLFCAHGLCFWIGDVRWLLLLRSLCIKIYSSFSRQKQHVCSQDFLHIHHQKDRSSLFNIHAESLPAHPSVCLVKILKD